jgi:SHS2 domain-containing protein
MTHFERSEKKGSERSEGSYSFKILPHPADVKLQITASTKEELFQGALAGMASIISSEAPPAGRAGKNKVLPSRARQVLISSEARKKVLPTNGRQVLIDAKLSKNAQIVKENIEVQSLDFNALLVDFLSEVLAKTDISHTVFNKLKIKKLTDNFLQTEIEGQKIDYFGQEIKAATHHGLEIKQDKSGNYGVTILFDI